MGYDNGAIGLLGCVCLIVSAWIISLVLVPFAIMWFWNSFLIGIIGLGLAKISYLTAVLISVVLVLFRLWA